MSEFDSHWKFITKRSVGFPTVQEYHELEFVFNKMKGCNSYLEIGTAEGNSLYVLAQALAPNAKVTCVDLCEKHTSIPRAEIINLLSGMGIYPMVYAGNSTNSDTLPAKENYECVLIDGGHDYATVISDAKMYGSLATKYIFFHDVCLPEVNKAFDEYVASRPECKSYKMINSTTFGYGIIEV